MRNKKIFCMFIFVFMIVLSIAAVSAQDADDAIASADNDDDVVSGDIEPVSGSVSGGVDVKTENPGTTSGQLTYDIPADAKTIKSADVYVNVYSGSAANTYGANANITISTVNGDTNKSESLWIPEGGQNGTVYNVSDHVTKCYSDYMIHYDITSLLSGLNGTSLAIKVDTFEYENKSFDGRIKLIGLVLAYDDGDNDTINYWVDYNQRWTKSDVNVTFDTKGLSGIYAASLTNVVLSSGDGTYRINGELIGDPTNHSTGNEFYYQYNKWDDVAKFINSNQTTLNVAYAGTSAYGSIKNVLSVLTANTLISDVSLKPEYKGYCYAGTNNTITVTVNTNKAGKYTVVLLANGTAVSQVEKDLINGSNTVLITDPTVRPVDETTEIGANNTKVNYTVELLLNNNKVNSNSIVVPVVYNGNLGKDLAYPAGGFDNVVEYIANDIKVDIQNSGYLGKGQMNRTDVWTINLDENSTIVRAFVYVPYNWFDPTLGVAEDENMFNATFNGVAVTPVAFYRDQSNLGGYGAYGYGLLVYDVTDLTNKTGDNSFNLTKKAIYPAVYPSVLVYMYNTTGVNTIKEVYITDGADLLASTSSTFNNDANRTIKADSTIDVYSKFADNATLYVFAAGAEVNEGNVVFNGKAYENVWSGTSQTSDLYTLDVTSSIKDINSVSFVSTGKTILALQQMIVLTKDEDAVSMSLAPEYPKGPYAYAGTNNAITITIDIMSGGKYTVELYADGVKVNSTEKDLLYGTNTLILIDPTIRPVNETTAVTANNTKTNYTAKLVAANTTVSQVSVVMPVVYNGNLGKDLAYPAGGYESFLNVSVTGDIVILINGESSYLGKGQMNRTDVWVSNLAETSSIVKAFVYVPYNWFDPTIGVAEDKNMFNATFNGVAVTPVAFYRDQSNLGGYGAYGYGLLVYDVTNLTNANGNNSFNLVKKAVYPAVYPSVFIYMYDTEGSTVRKDIYISNGADLLASYASTFKNNANRTVKADSTIAVGSLGYDATLYVFAAGAQTNEGNVVINGNNLENVWSGTSKTTDLYKATPTVDTVNNISFVSTGQTILALQQIMVITKDNPLPTTLTASGVSTVYQTSKNIVVTLKDYSGNAIEGANVTISFNGAKKVITTDANGKAVYAIGSKLVPKTYTATITYAGDNIHIKSSATAKVVVKKAASKITAKKKTFKVKVKTKKYVITLKNNKGKAIKKAKVTLKVKGKTYKAKTNAKGKATFKITKLTKKGKHTATITFKGDKYYKKATKKVKITVKK